MISSLLKLLQANTTQEKQNSEHDIRLAAVALLVEVAKADHHLSELEENKLLHIVNNLYDLNETEQSALIAAAKNKSSEATSLYEYTSVINENFSEHEKFQLITQMWKMAFSDNQIDSYEEHLIRRVADLIYLPHVKFIEAKHIADTN